MQAEETLNALKLREGGWKPYVLETRNSGVNMKDLSAYTAHALKASLPAMNWEAIKTFKGFQLIYMPYYL
jgi:hypothetical protein